MVLKTLSIDFPFALPSANDIYTAHWRKVKNLADSIKEQTATVLLGYKHKKVRAPASITYTVYVGNFNRDADNFCGKWVLDLVVKNGILPKDSLPYVRSVTYTGERANKKPHGYNEHTVMRIDSL